MPRRPNRGYQYPPGRRSIEFLPEEDQSVESCEAPIIEFEPADSRVVVTGTFVGATPRTVHQKDMVLVDRLQYTEHSDTLHVRLVERDCRSGGAGVGGEVTPYILRVQFPDNLPQRVCIEERGGSDTDICVSR